ncbi:hypothetical protein C8Q76DRAFT_769775 [Earliella scabrosa]|nr:hypothetical protein C8Q76DRAFT_769775 [Earliella scabrosa]
MPDHARNQSTGLCDYPIVSLLPPCVTSTATSSLSLAPSASRADFPGLVEIQHRALDQLTTKAGAGADLALNIKHAELAVRDLVLMVQTSDLTIKDALASRLLDFVADSRHTARSLQVLSSKVHGTIDRHSAKTSSSGSSTSTSIDRAILHTFQASLAWFTSAISAIIIETSTAAASLDRLDQHLSAAHALCLREESVNALALDDLLWELWTRLGGNRHKIRELKNRASLLKNAQKYRSIAVTYVAGTMQVLTVVEAELSELRDRLSAPSLDANQVPLEVQLASIQSSIRRMKEGHLGGGNQLTLGDAE